MGGENTVRNAIITTIIVIGALVVAALVAGFIAGNLSKSGAPLGLTESGALAPCPDRPNCVNSQAEPGARAAIAPLTVAGPDKAAAIKSAMAEIGAELVAEQGGYLAFIATSAVFGFVDDVEFLIDEDAVHVRSASRVGYGDAGVNRARVERIRSILASS